MRLKRGQLVWWINDNGWVNEGVFIRRVNGMVYLWVQGGGVYTMPHQLMANRREVFTTWADAENLARVVREWIADQE